MTVLRRPALCALTHIPAQHVAARSFSSTPAALSRRPNTPKPADIREHQYPRRGSAMPLDYARVPINFRVKKEPTPEVPVEPILTPKYPTMDQLRTPMPPKQVFPAPKPRTTPRIPFHKRIKPERRTIYDTDLNLPLPNSYKLSGVDPKSRRPLVPAQKLSSEESPYPYKYYEIAQIRSVIGLPHTTREHIAKLGLSGLSTVVWRKIDENCAGMILKVKELVRVRLVNEIPPKPLRPVGYIKVGSMVRREV
ncbi:hypothetical protein HDV00_001162 [Rhizophlyctis rosea]|nr:hypothetical protein HDV00_001162 [Rhizophlyctis rosea]